MKTFSKLILMTTFLAFGLNSCVQDTCTTTRKFIQNTPVFATTEDIRNAKVEVLKARTLKNPGKIYFYNNYILINELHEGLHVIDNTNPSSPQNIAFISIPYNEDMAIKDGILYANSYYDLLSIDISDVKNPKLVDRLQDVLGYYQLSPLQQHVVYYRKDLVTLNMDCDQNFVTNAAAGNGGVFFESADASTLSGTKGNSNSVSSGTGTGGSMARFTIANNHLFTVSQANLNVFELNTPSKPREVKEVNIGWNIETIYPFQDKMFIGSTTGMYIYDVSTPSSPRQLSIFSHALACDPVVTDGETAYITLRSETNCRDVNELDVVDVKDLSRPTLIKSYKMSNPHGLSIDDNTLFICEGQDGLKVFDATDKTKIDANLWEHQKGFDAYDVIVIGGKNIALVIGDDGFYQFDISNRKSLKQLSKIPIVKN